MLFKKLVIFYLCGFLLNITLFVLLFNLDLGIKTFFYKGLLITLICIVVQYLILKNIIKFKFLMINKLHAIIICFATLTFTMLLHTLILTSLDRAISVFFISLMNSQESGLTERNIKEEFYSKYFEQDKAIERRIKEQLITGNIIKKDNKYIITERGKFTFKSFQALSKIFNIENNYVPDYKFK